MGRGRNIRDNRDFDNVLEMVKGVSGLGLEVYLHTGHAHRRPGKKTQRKQGSMPITMIWMLLKRALPHIITTREYKDRLDTLTHVRNAGVSVFRRHHRTG